MLHNVRVDQIRKTRKKAEANRDEARLEISLAGNWRVGADERQFGGEVAFPKGKVLFEADFPSFFGGEGRAPTPLAYCFYGAMCCYGATFATQAAMAGVELHSMTIGLKLAVDFRAALGIGEYPPLEPFTLTVSVETDATDAQVQEVKQLTDARCPALWAMNNKVPFETAATKA